MKIEPIFTQDQYNNVIAEAIPLIERSLKYTPECTLQSTLQRISDGYALLWIISDSLDNYKGVVVVELKKYPNYNVALGHLCGGYDIDDWIHLLSDIEAWAIQEGCRCFEIQGRKGWAKKLPKEYKSETVIYRKEFLQ